MKMNAKTLICAAALALPLAASAEDQLSYRYVDVAHFPQAEIDGDAIDVDGDGIQLRGSLPSIRIFSRSPNIQSLDLDNGIDATRFLVGAGGHWAAGPEPGPHRARRLGAV